MKNIIGISLILAAVCLPSSSYAAAFDVHYGNLYNAQIQDGRLIPPTTPAYGAVWYDYLTEDFYGPGKGRLVGITSYISRDRDSWSFTYQGNTDKLIAAVNTYYGRVKQYTATFIFTAKGEIKSYDYSLRVYFSPGYYGYGKAIALHDEYSYKYDEKGRMKKATCVTTCVTRDFANGVEKISEDYKRTTVKRFDKKGRLEKEDVETKQYTTVSGRRLLSSETASHDVYFRGFRFYNNTLYKEYDVSTGALVKYTRTQTIYGADGKPLHVVVTDLMPKAAVQRKPNYTFTGTMAVQPKTQGLLQK